MAILGIHQRQNCKAANAPDTLTSDEGEYPLLVRGVIPATLLVSRRGRSC
jgi:hypothetical protein